MCVSQICILFPQGTPPQENTWAKQWRGGLFLVSPLGLVLDRKCQMLPQLKSQSAHIHENDSHKRVHGVFPLAMPRSKRSSEHRGVYTVQSEYVAFSTQI